jgi:hypothetical protein
MGTPDASTSSAPPSANGESIGQWLTARHGHCRPIEHLHSRADPVTVITSSASVPWTRTVSDGCRWSQPRVAGQVKVDLRDLGGGQIADRDLICRCPKH